MLPSQLTIEQFKGYPGEARNVVTAHIAIFQQLPLSFLPLLLRELIAYDWKFPAERKELDHQLQYLSSLSAEQAAQVMEPFARIRLSPELERLDWVNDPIQFSEHLTAHLWATHQIDAFRSASVEYIHKLNSTVALEPLPISRLGIIVIGQGVGENKYPLFRKLRPQGVCFTNVRSENGFEILLDSVAARAKSHPVPFGHWYVDGGEKAAARAGLTCVSYASLSSMRDALLGKMRKVMEQGGGGPEMLRSMLAQMTPEDLGFSGAGDQAVLNRFQVSLLTEGSGTQIFSTTFVQWSAREILRRAQPLTLLARYAPRQRDRSIKELIAGRQKAPVADPQGSLIDADMGAYYTWINQQRLASAERASFLVWFENHNEALAISPSLPHGTESDHSLDLHELLSQLA